MGNNKIRVEPVLRFPEKILNIRVLGDFSFVSTPEKVSSLTMLILILLIVIGETPILSRNVPNVVYYGLILLFFAVSLNLYSFLQEHQKIALCVVFLYAVLIGNYKILKISSASLSYYSTTVKFLFWFVIMIGITGKMTREQRKLLLFVIFCSVAITIASNILLYLRYGAYRYVHLFQKERFTTNSVNTQYVAALSIMSGTLFIFGLSAKGRPGRLLSLAFCALSLFFSIIIAQRTIILVMALVMLPLLWYVSRPQKGRIIIVVLLIGVFLLMVNYYQTVLRWIGELTGSTRIKARFEQIIVLLSSGDAKEAGGSLAARMRLMKTSLDTWSSSFAHIVFGAGDHRTTNLVIGNHSHLIDELARYGLTGLLVWVPMLAFICREITFCSIKNGDRFLRNELFCMLFVYVMRGFIGGIYDPAIGIQMFLVLPLMLRSLEEERNGKVSLQIQEGE